ncbi:MAG: hypothetical protein Q9166_004835 [cf. Caloplaca sp. 2 TL-2023]
MPNMGGADGGNRGYLARSLGPARLILNSCVRQQQTGGIDTEIGRNRKLEVLVYDARSIFGYTRILDHSPDPEARSIAMQELMELLDVTPRPDRLDIIKQLQAQNEDANGTTTTPGQQRTSL